MITELIAGFASLPQVEAIALGGSRAGDRYDEKSDYDVYLYCTSPVSEATRKEILAKHCSYMELGNHYWEYEDNCTLNNGIDIDILYRNLDHFIADISTVVELCQGRNGYTTCMWHNLLNCKILYDRTGRLAAAKQRFDIPYPAALKQEIVTRNYRLLHGILPSYDLQISKAILRGDLFSVNHRVTAFLESYFDILFALNGQTHPGEKRLISLCKERCPVLPDHFEENITHLLRDMYAAPDCVTADLARVICELDKIL